MYGVTTVDFGVEKYYRSTSGYSCYFFVYFCLVFGLTVSGVRLVSSLNSDESYSVSVLEKSSYSGLLLLELFFIFLVMDSSMLFNDEVKQHQKMQELTIIEQQVIKIIKQQRTTTVSKLSDTKLDQFDNLITNSASVSSESTSVGVSFLEWGCSFVYILGISVVYLLEFFSSLVTFSLGSSSCSTISDFTVVFYSCS